MSFFVRLWIDEGEILAVHSQEHTIAKDVVDHPGATVIDAVVSGDYMLAYDVHQAAHLVGDTFTLAGRTVVSGTPEVRSGARPTPAELLTAERSRMIVSAFQARAALDGAGLLAAAEVAVAAEGGITQLAWEKAVEFKRNSQTIVAMGAILGLTDEQIDDLFRTAKGIEA